MYGPGIEGLDNSQEVCMKLDTELSHSLFFIIYPTCGDSSKRASYLVSEGVNWGREESHTFQLLLSNDTFKSCIFQTILCKQ